MMKQKKRAYHFETSSLLPLKLALIQAGKDAPPPAPKEGKDVNEELALRLIARMKNDHVIAVFALSGGSNGSREPQAKRGPKQSPLNKKIASFTPLARNDIELEP